MADEFDALIANIQNYVVSPLNAFGLAGFVFDVEGESVATLSSDITDHYTEDNKAIQDHIAIHPKKITLKGYVGELIFTGNTEGLPFLQQAVQKLTTLTSYLPTLSNAATQIVGTMQSPTTSDITLSDSSNIFGLVKNLIGTFGDQAKQQQGYAYFKALQQQGILMGVQTPWEFMTNMAIESITVIQDERSRSFSDFSVTLKEIRIAKTQTTAYVPSPSPSSANPSGNTTTQLQGAAADQAANQVQIGDVPGLAVPTSTIKGKLSQVTGVQSLYAGVSPSVADIFNYDQGL